MLPPKENARLIKLSNRVIFELETRSLIVHNTSFPNWIIAPRWHAKPRQSQQLGWSAFPQGADKLFICSGVYWVIVNPVV